MIILAIDPGTNLCGLAVFDYGRLTHTMTVGTKNLERRMRQTDIIEQVLDFIRAMPTEGVDIVVMEDPFLQGIGNKTMQRFIGALESHIDAPFIYYMSTQIKKAMGFGKLSKLEMAINAGQLLKLESEQEILADAIRREAFDETDAIAVGLTYFQKKEIKT